MKPCLKHRRVVEVPAGMAWRVTLKHRIYSCPDHPTHDFVLNATALILLNGKAGARVPLEVVAVEKFVPDEHAQFDALPERYRARVQNYLAEVVAVPGIIQAGRTYRLYLLSDEPWPDWLQQLTSPSSLSATEWSAFLSICAEPERFFEWPQVGEVLWPGCTREDSEQQHDYSQELAARLGRLGLQPDPRSNGPAIMSFLVAGGRRPLWGSEGWPIHHIYDGTAPVPDHPVPVPHAVRDGRYFTHSGGLVAAHPIAHHLAHQSALLKWLLRREAFLRFGFDPMNVFSQP